MPIKDPLRRKLYHAEYMKNVWYPKNRNRHIQAVTSLKRKLSLFVSEYKRGSKCKDCGLSGKDYPQVLEFDHLGDKKFSVGGFSRYILGMDTLKREMAKCDLVCANCHRIRTVKRIDHNKNSGMEK